MPTVISFSTSLPIISVIIRKVGQPDATDISALLDTGAGYSLISDDLMQSHARTPGRPITTVSTCLVGSTQPIIFPLYDFDEIEIGGRSYQGFTALSTDFSFFDETAPGTGIWARTSQPFKVIIGMELQRQIGAITVDQSTKTITLP